MTAGRAGRGSGFGGGRGARQARPARLVVRALHVAQLQLRGDEELREGVLLALALAVAPDAHRARLARVADPREGAAARLQPHAPERQREARAARQLPGPARASTSTSAGAGNPHQHVVRLPRRDRVAPRIARLAAEDEQRAWPRMLNTGGP